ncbi:hypothetical protein [Thiocystis violacea]|uniref:hypothetical protein n=1 Tax=Thiocystis violacea TaxID=13725 RepID=UPI001904B355|nr:hypothetical protein [Thiocystis violacea]MBK1723897.1 hypothetical protein [Thiocystis violacea]
MFLITRDFLTVLLVFLALMLVFWLETSSVNEEAPMQQEAMQTAQLSSNLHQNAAKTPEAY